jgi:hypothetical protein
MQVLRDAFHEAWEKENPSSKRLWNGIKVAPDAVFALIEAQMRPIMMYVQYMKAGAAFRAAADEMAKLPPNVTKEEFLRRMSKVQQEMNSRYGQVIYENYFMPQVVKDVAQILFRAPGWTAGGAHLLARGGVQLATAGARIARRVLGGKAKPDEELIGRTGRYLLASVAGFLLVNAILNYIHTGERPKGKDWWFPRDGTLDQSGNPNRFTIPGYEAKDWYNWVSHPLKTLLNKRKRVLGAIPHLISDRDWKGDFLWDPDHPTIGGIAKAAVKELAQPITFSNIERMRAQAAGKSLPERLAPFAGISPASQEVQRTAAQNLMARYLARVERTPHTPEQQQAFAAQADTLRMLRRGEPVEASRKLALKASADPLAAQFKRLTLEQKEEVFRLGEPWEQEQWSDILARAEQRGGTSGEGRMRQRRERTRRR